MSPPISGRNEPRVTCESRPTLRRCYAARTAQRAVPTNGWNHHDSPLPGMGHDILQSNLAACLTCWTSLAVKLPPQSFHVPAVSLLGLTLSPSNFLASSAE